MLIARFVISDKDQITMKTIFSDQPQPPLSNAARIAGYAGLLPQAIAIMLVLSGDEYKWFGVAGGFQYAALIFSFLGGIWWGLATQSKNAPSWIYGVAVAPSLIGLAAYLPWILGWDWPGPWLGLLGLCLMLSPLVDRKIGTLVALPAGWVTMRWILSTGLGMMTVILGWIA
jgi:Protein of unknown function (DUF3429)